MKIKFVLPKVTVLLMVMIALVSCEDDFSTLGSEIFEGQNPEISLDDAATVIAYSEKFKPVKTNQLPVNSLGVYNDPLYGKSTVSLLSQVTLSELDPDFGEEPELEKATLYLPFFSEETTLEETTTFELDSVFGAQPIKISLYESTYFLRDLDPTTNFEDTQEYYSDQGNLFENFQGELIGEIIDFVPSDEGFVINEGDEEEEETLSPGIRVDLPLEFFQQKILDAGGTQDLISVNNFKNYFRGIYFKVESTTDDGTFFLFNVAEGRIELDYNYLPEGEDERETSSINLQFNGINVNVYENDINPTIASELQNQDKINGEEKLYIRGGGEGIVSVINLFGEDIDGNGVADELELLREKKWLINEANLVFHVKQSDIESGSTEPERILIYNLESGQLLVDYGLDSSVATEPIDAISNHLGRLERNDSNEGLSYKIKITTHLSNIINRDSTNVPLGVVVTQNVTVPQFQNVRTMVLQGTSEESSIDVKQIPAGAIISPEGTVLHGNLAPDEAKRLKLQIYYTEPN
ncbi:DUF4270 domain-containing protein [Cochleicola gelatinilyticus]|uniref:DUF4270 domain-containing protein n=1 Tax=Cochleicola gelatinilyticus TaxID=1763537 RepID=A0A167IUX1_9FLAO|nr:DUF4270 domain-containing protein [Cochleicola gelatinilyticus]OAB80040.1 hypothetical protein ULVI_04685 [Cochleicola gelatinilyticus]